MSGVYFNPTGDYYSNEPYSYQYRGCDGCHGKGYYRFPFRKRTCGECCGTGQERCVLNSVYRGLGQSHLSDPYNLQHQQYRQNQMSRW